MKHKAIIIAFVIGSACASAMSTPAAYTLHRRDSAAERIKLFDQKKAVLDENNFMLFTLTTPVSDASLLSSIAKSEARLGAVYICENTGAVTAVLLDETRSAPQQLAPRVREALADLKLNQSGGKDSGSKISTTVEYCGFDVQGAYEATWKLRQLLQKSIFMVEITTRRMRLLPPNAIGFDRQGVSQ